MLPIGPTSLVVDVFVLVVLGLAAGALTSLAGQGGGLLLLIACSAVYSPHAALVTTAPALLLGNLHRAWLYRGSVDRPIAWRMTLGGLPGALLGGLVAGIMPEGVFDVVLVAMSALAIAKALGWIRFSVPRRALAPAGFGIGAMTGTAGGAGVLLAPVLLSSGLSGATYVGTSSVVAVVTHLGRVAAYGSVGLFANGGARLLLAAVTLALAIFGGNSLAERLRPKLTARAASRIEYVTLAVCVALSVARIR
jgi:uncharacterized membrane protein YfcA